MINYRPIVEVVGLHGIRLLYTSIIFILLLKILDLINILWEMMNALDLTSILWDPPYSLGYRIYE